jgi:hypothetical protein
VVNYSAAVAAHTVTAAPCKRAEPPPTALVRVHSFVLLLVAPLHSEQISLISPGGVLAAVFAVYHVTKFLKLARF